MANEFELEFELFLCLSEVVWPEQLERRSGSRELCLSTQALRHLLPSPSPVDMADGTQQPEDEQPLISGVCGLVSKDDHNNVDA